MTQDRLTRQIEFIMEVDKLKSVLRQTVITSKERNENSAEHSWHLALMAVVLAEYANEPVDLLRVIKMAIVHDLVEIDAGDTFIYDEKGHEDKAEREERAADRIFGLLPGQQESELRALWDEYEAQETPEARFAMALDRLNPMLLNYHTGGPAWKKHGIRADQVVARNQRIERGAAPLWEYAREIIREAVDRGYLQPARSE